MDQMLAVTPKNRDGTPPGVFPKAVRGPVRRAKWLVIAALMAIYYGTPWLRWNRGPYAPDQAILIDLPGRKAFFLWFEIWPQEIYVITGVLFLMAIGLFFVTALAGRVWCGWACPQTVWTDLFMLVERMIEGDRAQRMRLAAAAWTPGKIVRRLAKHAIWIVIAALTGGAWVLYFNDAPALVASLVRGEPSAGVLGTIAVLTGTTYLLAGWARESVCTFMCPYARFQSAMLDPDSLVVAYRAHRGEPRGKHKAGADWAGRGHCVDCRQCVEVCPTGIDIRKGLQMTCIACGLCVDACDGIMQRLDLPRGLIGWDTERNLEAAARGGTARPRWLRARTMAYGALYAIGGVLLLAVLLGRAELEASLLPDRAPLYVRLTDGGIRNGFTVKILNKTTEVHEVTVAVAGLPGAVLTPVEALAVRLRPDTVTPLRLFVTLPPGAWTGTPRPFDLLITAPDRGLTVVLPAHFEGPKP